MDQVGRFGLAFLATVVVVLGSTLPAYAQEAPPPPADTSTEPTSSTTTSTTTEAPPAATTQAEPAPQQAPPAEPDPAPSAKTTDGGTTEKSAPTPEGTTAEPAPTTTPEDVVTLEEETASAPTAAPAAAPAAAPSPAATPEQPATAPTNVTIVLQSEPAPAAAIPAETPPATAAANAEATIAGASTIVILRPRSAIALLPDDQEQQADTARDPARKPTVVASKVLLKQSCARPTGRVPLSKQCKQARAVAVLRVTLTYAWSPAEVRAAIARGVAPVAVKQQVDARPPPDSKAAKKHPVAQVRPMVPFGSSGQGATRDGFNGASGSTWSSRVFALAPVPLRVPLPRRFARLRLPSTIPHGVIAAPPTTRPG